MSRSARKRRYRARRSLERRFGHSLVRSCMVYYMKLSKLTGIPLGELFAVRATLGPPTLDLMGVSKFPAFELAPIPVDTKGRLLDN